MDFVGAASRFLSGYTAVNRAEESCPLNAELLHFYEQHRHPLFRYLLAFGLPASDCEEIIQEVFLALFRHLLDGKPRHNLQSWLFRVAHNLALKSRSREGSRADLSGVANTLDPSLDPEQALLQSQQQKRLAAVVAALPEQDRECLALRAEGLRYRAISDVLGISLGAVSLSLKRSLAKLSEVCER